MSLTALSFLFLFHFILIKRGIFTPAWPHIHVCFCSLMPLWAVIVSFPTAKSLVYVCWEMAACWRLWVWLVSWCEKVYEWQNVSLICNHCNDVRSLDCSEHIYECVCVLCVQTHTRSCLPFVFCWWLKTDSFLHRSGKPSAPQCGPPVQGEDHCKYCLLWHLHATPVIIFCTDFLFIQSFVTILHYLKLDSSDGILAYISK